MRRAIAILAGLAVLALVNVSIVRRERLLEEGRVVLLELAPVDPRSLMQGDYMALRFRLAQDIERARGSGGLRERERRAPLQIDARGVAQLGSSTAGAPSIHFKIRNGAVWLGTNAFFFEEGTAQRFEQARYGEFRLDEASGEAVLIGLADDHLRPL